MDIVSSKKGKRVKHKTKSVPVIQSDIDLCILRTAPSKDLTQRVIDDSQRINCEPYDADVPGVQYHLCRFCQVSFPSDDLLMCHNPVSNLICVEPFKNAQNTLS